MIEARTWSVHGQGLIGGEIVRQLANPEVAARPGLNLKPAPEFTTDSKFAYSSGGDVLTPDYRELPPTDVTFVAIPPTQDGNTARGIILPQLVAGKMAITGEKAYLANFFAEAREASDDFATLGARAAAGGGTRLVHAILEYCHDPANVDELHMVLNGTMTSILSKYGPIEGAGSGMSLGQAVQQSVDLGYADPGATSPKEVLRSEAQGDAPMKTAIILNSIGLSDKILNWKDLRFELSNEQIQEVRAEARIRRFIVSVFRANNADVPEPDVIGGFDHRHDDLRIVGGFQNINVNPLLAPLGQLTDAGNGATISLGPNGSDGKYLTGTGDGAGKRQTVNAMLDDLIVRTKPVNPFI